MSMRSNIKLELHNYFLGFVIISLLYLLTTSGNHWLSSPMWLCKFWTWIFESWLAIDWYIQSLDAFLQLKKEKHEFVHHSKIPRWPCKILIYYGRFPHYTQLTIYEILRVQYHEIVFYYMLKSRIIDYFFDFLELSYTIQW